MSVTLRLVHRAGYTYSGPATASYNEARMVPRSTAGQTVQHTRLEITPTPWQESWTDYFGTRVTTFELHEPHDALTAVATSTVEVDRKPVDGRRLTWEQLTGSEVTDDLEEFLAIGDRCEPGPELRAAAAELRGASATPAQFVAAVLDQVRSGARASKDRAHVVIGMLRSQGVPARFVAGYVLPDRDAAIGDVLDGEAQAWIEWWDGAWVAVDPVNGRAPDDFYIEVAHGRDYTDVVPLRGIFTGTPGSKMVVTVEISRLA
ncbi:transglutaminase family protein [Metallococcus carri]|uniref:transglutaminase family protein n=1 Tax=Metallococcus carri TaxID=1656884 RepID=UPI002E2979E7|nr:transglutaminase N-terminal domain-containing protein [Metallococcus carri]